MEESYSWRDESPSEEQDMGSSDLSWRKVHDWLQMGFYSEIQL